ncbi:uncharacterized protein LOC104456882 [Eucalyptus grandis]|uniref:uncharacterized protein LOC104456882 n=1 Tax=Eucalyptus grandis TaxID=71139 RepID=UPI00192ECC91|nr:uncharacterized protein LOC104456882 [Eucalyptus grandis]
MEEDIVLAQWIKEPEDLAAEREEESVVQFEEELREREGLRIEIEVYKEKFCDLEAEREKQMEFLLKIADSIKAVKESLARIIQSPDDEKVVEREEDESLDTGEELDRESRLVREEILEGTRLVYRVESKVNDYKETKKKERKHLENSEVSLTEENRDISSLSRIALVKKEAMEKSLNKLRGVMSRRGWHCCNLLNKGYRESGLGL